MKKLSFQEKISFNKRNETKRTIRNALRGAAKPWTLQQCQAVFTSELSSTERLELFTKNIGGIFPLILGMVASGQTIVDCEKQIGLNRRMLHQWLSKRRVLMDKVMEARRLRGWVDDEGLDFEAP